MSFCSHGLSFLNLNQSSGGLEVIAWQLASAHDPEAHVVHHGDDETHGVGAHHEVVRHLEEFQLHVHQVPCAQHGVHQHYWVQGYHGGHHVLLQP